MALKGCFIWGCSKAPQFGFASFQPASSKLSVNLRYDLEKCRKWECSFGVLAQRALTGVESSGAGDGVCVQKNESTGCHQDVNMLPKPLTASEFSSSRDVSNVRVAYQGAPGSYSEDAALKAYPKCETVPCDDFEAVFKAVELCLVDKAVLPIECSFSGSIHRNYDLLLSNRLHIVGEVQLQIKYCLLGLVGVKIEELKGVMSHPQALAQCEMMLRDLGVVKIGANDTTAAAAKEVASKGVSDTGAIASSRAANIYGLDILAEDIQLIFVLEDLNMDEKEAKIALLTAHSLTPFIGFIRRQDDDNITRFLILAREPIIPGIDRPYKTSIVFNLEGGPGVLFKALGAFALRNIKILKIESRPMKQRPLRVVDYSNEGSAKSFDYVFYIDFEASMADPRAQYALENLQEYARFIRVLGCYPMDRTL